MHKKIVIGLLFALLLLNGCVETLAPESPTAAEPPALVESPENSTPSADTSLNPTTDPNSNTLDGTTPSNTVTNPETPSPPPMDIPIPPVSNTTILLDNAEIATHGKMNDCRMIIRENVYDLSTFVNHPGGTAFIPYCGKDGTKPYEAQGHSKNADAMLEKFFLGAVGSSIPDPKAG